MNQKIKIGIAAVVILGLAGVGIYYWKKSKQAVVIPLSDNKTHQKGMATKIVQSGKAIKSTQTYSRG